MKPPFEICDRCRCEKPLSDPICRVCLGVCKVQLKKLLDLYRFSTNAATLLPGNGGSGSRSSERTIGVKTPALNFSHGIDLVRLLSSWKEWIWDAYDFEADFGPYRIPVSSSTYSVPNLIEFLLVHFAKFPQNLEMATFLIDEVEKFYNDGLAEVGLTTPKQNRVRCPADWIDNKNCNMTLIVDGSDLHAEIVCRRCKSVWTVARLMYLISTTPGISFYASAFQIADYKGLTVRAVRYRLEKWEIPKLKKEALYHFGKFNEKFEQEQEKSRNNPRNTRGK